MNKKTLVIFIILVGIGFGVAYMLKPHTALTPITDHSTNSTSTQPTPPFSYHPVSVHLNNKPAFSLTIPTDYTLSVAAEGLKKVRFLTLSPDGRLFAGEVGGQGDTKNGSVLIFDNFNPKTNRFNTITHYLNNLRNPNSVAFYTDQNNTTWLYIALTDKLIRYKYSAGDNTPTDAPQTIATFPDYGLPPNQGGWHLTRTVLAHNDKIYVSVGSSCNACEEKETELTRASVVVMDPDGKNEHVFASGLRNAVGLTFVGDNLYATEMGVDHLGNDKPNDTLYKLEQDKNYGWPYCYKADGENYYDSTIKWKKSPPDCNTIPQALSYFPAHSAPLGLTYVDDTFADLRLRNGFLVALHGSGKPTIGTGYKIAQVTPDGKSEDIISGFLQGSARVSRPVSIVFKDNQSFFFSDDYNGALYYVTYSKLDS